MKKLMILTGLVVLGISLKGQEKPVTIRHGEMRVNLTSSSRYLFPMYDESMPLHEAISKYCYPLGYASNEPVFHWEQPGKNQNEYWSPLPKIIPCLRKTEYVDDYFYVTSSSSTAHWTFPVGKSPSEITNFKGNYNQLTLDPTTRSRKKHSWIWSGCFIAGIEIAAVILGAKWLYSKIRG